jgi:nucleoside-diphosphate-sugar epimerase
MKILVTGGTGFVGSHSATTLRAQGHEVRLLVRDPARCGATEHELAAGDMTDPVAVAAAVRGCDAVLHAAALYAFGPRQTRTIHDVNTRGTEVVLDAAIDAGCDPIVHVSSYSALLPQTERLHPDLPVGTIATPYAASKAAADRIARDRQDAGDPVTISYPGFVLGPHDPYVGESTRLVLSLLRGQIPMRLHGVLPNADVRYVAAAHAAMMEPSRGPRRYLVTGHDIDAEDLRGELGRLTGRRLRTFPASRSAALVGGKVADAIQRVLPVHLAAGYEGPHILGAMPRAGPDTSRTRAELGVAPPPVEETVRDTLEWLVADGHLSGKTAGAVAT